MASTGKSWLSRIAPVGGQVGDRRGGVQGHQVQEIEGLEPS